MKTRRDAKKKAEKGETEALMENLDLNADDEVANGSGETTYSDEDAKSDIEYLKNTPYNKETASTFKQKMLASREHRFDIIADKTSDFLKEFPYLFCHTDLVSCTFII